MQDENLADLLGVAAAWIAAARQNGFSGFLSAQDQFERDPTDEPTISKGASLTGIYFWIAENGEGYIGQALDIRKRLRTHFKNNPDLVAATYLCCKAEALDEIEKTQISRLQDAFPLRNILLVRQSAVHRPLDDIFDLEAQSAFPSVGNPEGWQRGPRRTFPILERRQRQKMARLAQQSEKLELGQIAVTFFVDACIPYPYGTEHRFWSVTAFDRGDMIARVNVGVQEVLTVHDCTTVRLLCPEKLSHFASRPLYRSGARAHSLSLEKCAEIFEKPTALQALRSHVISLMRHTTALNARSHCPAMFRPELITQAHHAA